MLIVLLLKFLPLPCSVVGVAVDPIGLPVVLLLLLLPLVLGECNRLLACGDTDDSCRLVGSSPAAVDPLVAADRGNRFDGGGESLLLLNGVSTYSFVSLSFSGRGAASVTGDVAAGGKLVSKLGGPKMLLLLLLLLTVATAESDGKAAGGRRREKVLAGCTRL